MLVFVATGLPFTYSVPVLPDSVTARCVQVFALTLWLELSRCSAPLPPVLMANRGRLDPALIVRNMYRLVPVPKSKTRDQVLTAEGRTQVATVKFVSPFTMPLGSDT